MPEDHLNALPPGHRIDEYEIVRVLGAGGFGITYLAFDHNLRAPVAIKEYFYAGLATRAGRGAVVPSSTSKVEDFKWGRDRFLDEARILARLDHPNIVHVHRCIEANSTAYIVMDYVESESLAVVLEKHGALTPPQWCRWMEPLLYGLQHVHRRDYLHRDIKPENILIRAADGEPVLVDFGSARRAATERTQHLTAVHTPGYAPLEQYSPSSRQGPATDIYGLAAVSYRVLTGEPPPAAPDRVLDDRYSPLAEQVGGSDHAWLKAMDQGLKLRPEERPATVAAWRAALENAGNASSVRTPPAPTEDDIPLPVSAAATQTGSVARERTEAVPDKRPSNRPLLLAAAIILTAGIVGQLLNAPATTREGSSVARTTATGLNNNPAGTTLPPRQRPQVRRPSPLPGTTPAPDSPPSTRVDDTSVSSSRVTGTPTSRESSSRPVAASVLGSAPRARTDDNTSAAGPSPDPRAPRESSPRAAATLASNPIPVALASYNTVVGRRAADPRTPRRSSPRAAAISTPGSTSRAPVDDNTAGGRRAIEPVRVGRNILPPPKTRNVQPVYPPVARAARVQGGVILEAVIDPSGRVTDVKVLRSEPMFDKAAIDAVKQWEYVPTLIDGVPVSLIMTVAVNFTL